MFPSAQNDGRWAYRAADAIRKPPAMLRRMS